MVEHIVMFSSGISSAITAEHGNQEIEIATQNGTSITREYNLKDIQFDPGYPPDDFEDGDTGTSSAIEIILSR